MLKLAQIKLLENTMLVQEYPVQVAKSVNSIQRTTEEIKHLEKTQVIRIGKVLLIGDVSVVDNTTANATSLLKGKQKELQDKDILYSVLAVDHVFDLDIEGYNKGQLVVVGIHGITGILLEDTDNG